MERCVGTDKRVWRGVLGPIVLYEAVCWDRYMIVERCVGTYSLVWSGVFGTDISVWSGVLGSDCLVFSGVFGPIVECEAVCWDR